MPKNSSESGLDRSLKIIAKTSFIVFIGLVISKILGYTFRVIVARYFGPEVYGLFALALTITSFFITIAAFGFGDGLIRFLPMLRAKGKTDEIRYLIKKTEKFYLVSGIIASIVLIFLADIISVQVFHNASLSPLLKIMAAGILFSLFANVFLIIIRSFEEIGWYSFIFNIFQNIVRVLVLIILLLIGLKSNGNLVIWAFVAGTIMALIFSYIVCKYKIKQIFGAYAKKDYSNLSRDFFNYSWPTIFYGIISLIFYWIDTFSLGIYKSAVEVGLYNAAVPIALLMAFVPELFMQMFFPLINKEYSNKNHKLIEQLSKQVVKWIFVVSLPIFILIFLYPGAALNILFGPQYLAAENALRLLLIGALISALCVVSNNLLSMLGKSKTILLAISAAALANFILNSILVPIPSILMFDNSTGMIGASLATLISIVLLNSIFVFNVRKHLLFVPLRRKMIKIALISLIPTAILLILKSIIQINIISIIIISASFILIYGILILVSHSLDENDWMIVKAIMKKLRK
jgi:O-antigen/teichoic acid export membrane protein